jgi:hypothetical protein
MLRRSKTSDRIVGAKNRNAKLKLNVVRRMAREKEGGTF